MLSTKRARKLDQRRADAQALEDYIDELLASNDPATVQTPPPTPAWHALDEEARDQLVKLLQEAVVNIHRQ